MKTLLRNEVAFTANLTDAPIPYSDISAMVLGWKIEEYNADVPTLPILLRMLTELGIKDSDEVLDGLSIDGEDLFIISTHFAGVIPEVLLPTATTDFGFIGPIVLPLNMSGLAAGIVPSYHVNVTSHAYCDTETLVLGIEHGVPIGKRFHYTKKNDTGDVTGTEIDMSKPNMNMVALLLFATTKPTTTNIQRTIKEVKILLAGKEEFHWNWFELGHGKCPQNILDDTVSGAIAVHWRIIIFPAGGIPANNLVVWTKSDTATDTLELIGIYQPV